MNNKNKIYDKWREGKEWRFIIPTQGYPVGIIIFSRIWHSGLIYLENCRKWYNTQFQF